MGAVSNRDFQGCGGDPSSQRPPTLIPGTEGAVPGPDGGDVARPSDGSAGRRVGRPRPDLQHPGPSDDQGPGEPDRAGPRVLESLSGSAARDRAPPGSRGEAAG